MANYYYLASLLPSLDFPGSPDISFASIRESLRLNLSETDLKKIEALRLFIDITNIRPLLLEESIDGRGNLSEKDLDEALLIKDFLPQYVFDFLDKHDTLSAKLHHFSELVSLFFANELPKQKGFLHKYFTFEREWRLVLLALRAKSAQRDVIKELQFEDFSDALVADILAQKDALAYDPPLEYQDLKEQFLSCGPDPWQQHKMLCTYRFGKIAEMVDGGQFSMDAILAYITQLMIVEYWNELDEQRGRVILDTFKSI